MKNISLYHIQNDAVNSDYGTALHVLFALFSSAFDNREGCFGSLRSTFKGTQWCSQRKDRAFYVDTRQQTSSYRGVSSHCQRCVHVQL